MCIFLVATTDLGSGRSADLQRLLLSLGSQPSELRRGMRMILVLQNATQEVLDQMGELPEYVETITVETRIPLSRARNLVLRRLLDSGVLTAEALVAYPDDDCWYMPNYLARVSDLFAADSQLGFWFCDFGSKPLPLSGNTVASRVARTRDIVRQAASITMVVRGDVAAAVGLFDETLGMGTANPGGEDTDYALRAFLVSPSTRIFNVPLMGHRDRGLSRSSYYRGSVLAISKHARRRFAIGGELLRKVAVGCVLVLRRELSLVSFVGAMMAAGARWRADLPAMVVLD